MLQLKPRIAIIDPFPDISNAETEIIERLQLAAGRIGAESVVIDPRGCIRGTDQHLEEAFAAEEIAFVLSLHFSTPKITRHFTYHAAWNPPQFLAELPGIDYSHSVQNLLSCDDFLTYDSIGINAHLKSILAPFGRSLAGASQLATGCAGDLFAPDASRIRDGKLFYCGVNWERLGGKGRHHEIFRILDQHPDRISIHGPELLLGVRPWGGYRCYEGEIPFDGVSMVRRIRDCGMALALSAPEHREADAASSRIFESCAAGAFIIADDSTFVQRTLGDAVYRIAYRADRPEETANAILEAVEWARSHPDDAAAMAKQCQEIYAARFTYEGQLTEIIARHAARRSAVGSCQEIGLTVVVAYAQTDEDGLRRTLNAVARQIQPPSEVIVACPAALADNAEAILRLSGVKRGRIIALPAEFSRACFYMPLGVPSTGDLLAHVLPDIATDYLAVLLPGQEWTELHAGAGLRRIAETDADVLVSGTLKERLDQSSAPVPPVCELHLPDSHSYAALVDNSIQPVLAALLFKTAFVRTTPLENLKFMDCNYLGSLLLLQGLCAGNVAFGGRVTAWQSARSLPENLKVEHRVRMWQAWHLHDVLRATAEWPAFRTSFFPIRAIAAQTPSFSRRFTNTVKRTLKPFPFLFRPAYLALLWWRRRAATR